MELHLARAADSIELELEALANGPYAIGHAAGQAVLVRGGAPGDRVLAKVTRRHARHLEAEVAAVLHPGDVRREPPCPYVATCGGCSWQQVVYAAQLAAKAEHAAREFARLGVPASAIAPPLAAPAEWNYRRRIRLTVDARGRLGFLRPRSRQVVEVESCLIAEPALNAALVAARRLVRGMDVPVSAVELASRGGLPGVVAIVAVQAPPGHRTRAHVERILASEPAISAAVVLGRGFVRTFGDVRVRIATPLGASIDVSPLAFSQVNPAANALLVRAVLEAAALSPTARVLELFAGAGNFTLALASHAASVHAVERDRFAAEALARAAHRLPSVTVERAAARVALERLGRSAAAFDLVIADPPRTGLKAELPGIFALRPKHFLYISCDLATLTRDARVILAQGYALDRLQLADLFPQTHHAEHVARFDRLG
jgi:23S rRNA (uracil1939-C5)-methyltransferase